MGLPKLQFQDLRKTFASLLAQKGVSTAVTQRLLEHSNPQLTNDVYTNVDPVLRQAISLLPGLTGCDELINKNWRIGWAGDQD